MANRDELLGQLELVLAGHPASHRLERLAASEVPSGPINDLDAAFALAERLGLGPLIGLLGLGQRARQLAIPIRLSDTPPTYQLPSPGQGEHTK